MPLKKSLLFLFVFISFSKINAQKFEMGKVSIAELEEKRHPTDTAAIAAVLFEKGKVDFSYNQNNGFVMITEVTARIKIYKKEGYDWATKAVQYYTGDVTNESVFFSDAVTYNLVNGKIEKTKLRSDGSFDEKVNEYWGRKKITMPNVKVGSVIEYKYVVKSARYDELTPWAFQSSIPVNFSEFTTHVPEYFVYNANFKGYISPKVSVEKGNKVLNYAYRANFDSNGQANLTTTQEKLEFLETKTVYLGENLPAMKAEAFVNNIENYTASITHELSITKYPNQPYKTYSSSWKSVANSIYNYDNFGLEIEKTGYFEDDLKAVTTGLGSTEEKISAIFNFVKANIKWNNYYGYSCKDGVKKAYKDKTGNVAEINLMMTAMLRHAGLTANPVLVSTRSNGIALFPNRTAFNYVVAAVETPNGFVLLDASDKFATPNILPFRALNWIGRLIRKDGTSVEVDLMPKVTSNDVVTMNYAIDATGLVSGKLRRQRTDYKAMLFRENIDDVKEDSYLEKLENDNHKIEIKEYSRTNEKELKLPVTETFSYAGSDFSEIIGGKIYVDPMLFYTDNENPFKQENREYPIDYGYPFMDKYAINIQIPDGYKVETLPAPALLSMEDNLGSFKFMTSSSGNTVQMSIMHQMNTPIISSEYYSMLKEFYQKMIEKQNEKIILTKI